MLAFLGEEQAHHAVAVVPVAGRAEKDIHRHAPADMHHTGGGVVPGLPAVKPVALVHQQGGQVLGRVSAKAYGFHELDDAFPLPAEVVSHGDL